MDTIDPQPQISYGLLRSSFLNGLLLWKTRRLKYTAILKGLENSERLAFLYGKAGQYFPQEQPVLRKFLSDQDLCGFIDHMISSISKYNLFPVNEYPCEEGSDSFVFHQIPIRALGFDSENEEMESWPLAVVVIQSLFFSDESFGHGCIDAHLRSHGVNLSYRPGELSGRENVFCSKSPPTGLPKEWKNLPELVQRSLYSTGYDFLDCTDLNLSESSIYPRWEDFDVLVDHWCKAQVIEENAAHMWSWINKSKNSRLNAMLKILREVTSSEYVSA